MFRNISIVLLITFIMVLSYSCGGGKGLIGVSGKAKVKTDIKIGSGSAKSAVKNESGSLTAIADLRILGYKVSPDFHKTGKVELSLVPLDADGNAILDPKLYFELNAKSNVKWPMECSIKVGEIIKPKENVPFAFAIDIDASGSMKSSDKDRLRVSAAKEFIKSIQSSFSGSIFSIHQFTSKKGAVKDIVSFTDDVNKLNEGIDTVIADGATPLHDSVYEVLDKVIAKKSSKYQPAVLILSDGADTASKKANVKKVVEKAKGAGIPLYAITLGGSPDFPLLDFTKDLQAYASGTGGAFTHASDAKNLNRAFENIAIGTTKGQIYATITIKATGGIFIPFTTITIKMKVHSGGKNKDASIDFIIPTS